jgi:hypothetical protein
MNYVDTLIYNLDCLTWLLVDETDQKSQKGQQYNIQKIKSNYSLYIDS